MDETILVRTIIEMLGKPKDHLEKIIRDYVEELGKETGVNVTKTDFAEAKQKEDSKDMFSCFVELEVEFQGIDKLMWFCFDFMPSSIEILNPEKFEYSAADFTSYINEIQTKLHKLDMLIKNFEADNKVLTTNVMKLIRNMIVVLVKEKPRTLADISAEAGVPENQIIKFLNIMEKEGKIVKKEDTYSLPN